MVGIAVDQDAELIGVAKGGEGSVNQPDDLAQPDVGGGTAKAISAFGAANAFDHAGVFQLQKNQFEEFFGKILFVGDVANPDGPLVVTPGQHHHGL